MQLTNIHSPQNLALSEEMLSATLFIKKGIKELYHIDGREDFYFIPSFLLAWGFKRHLKAILCMNYESIEKKTPSLEQFPCHPDEGKLLTYYEMLIKIISQPTSNKNVIKSVKQINNPLVKNIFKFLSNFEEGVNHYNWQLYFSESSTINSPQDSWQALEKELAIHAYPEEPDTYDNQNDLCKNTYYYRPIMEIWRKSILTVFKEITFLMEEGKLGEIATSQFKYLSHFLKLG